MAHILLSDDDESVLKVTAKILAKAGHRVTTSASGMEALQRLGLQPEDPAAALPDLIVLDIMMPKTDGYAVGTAIRGNSRTRAIPILVVSALREMSPLFTATVQVEGFLTKPFAPEELLAEVAKILAQHEARA